MSAVLRRIIRDPQSEKRLRRAAAHLLITQAYTDRLAVPLVEQMEADAFLPAEIRELATPLVQSGQLRRTPVPIVPTVRAAEE